MDAATGQHRYTGGQIEYNGLTSDWQGEGAIAYMYTSSSISPPSMSATQILQIAAAFCQSINVPVTVAGIAQYPVPREDGDGSMGILPDPLWPSRWQVTFSDQAIVEVVDGSGIICSFTNSAYFLRPKLQQAAGTLLSQGAATNFATLALQASAQTDAVGSAQGELVQYNLPQPYVGDSQWEFSWDRQLDGISYHNDSITAVVDAETGEIESFGIAYYTPPPVDTSVTVNAAQAQSAAQAQLMSSGIQDASMTRIQSKIVQPNSFWLDGTSNFASGAGRVAWVCSFGEPDGSTGEIWVDAQTGSVIGGFNDGSRGVRRAAPTQNLLNKTRRLLKKTSKAHIIKTHLVSKKPSHAKLIHKHNIF